MKTQGRTSALAALITAHFFSSIAFGADRVFIPLCAMSVAHASPSQLGLLVSIGVLPALAVSALLGSLIDNTSKRAILICAGLMRTLAMASIPILAAADKLSFTALCTVSVFISIGNVVFDLVDHAILPWIVPGTRLTAANSYIETSRISGETLGSSLAGSALGTLGSLPAAVMISFSFGMSTLFSALIPTGKPDNQGRSGSQLALLSAWREIKAVPTLYRIFLSAGVVNLASGGVSALYILLLKDSLAFSPAQIGLILALGCVGPLIASFLSSRLEISAGSDRAIFLSCIIGAATLLTLPLSCHFPKFALYLVLGQAVVGDGCLAMYSIDQCAAAEARSRVAGACVSSSKASIGPPLFRWLDSGWISGRVLRFVVVSMDRLSSRSWRPNLGISAGAGTQHLLRRGLIQMSIDL